jgi:hypothetical protein
MKANEWAQIVKPLLPASDGWGHRGKLAYQRPVRWVAVGVLGESSGSAKATYVWRLVLPLFVPSDVVNLSYSERVRSAGAVEDQHVDELRARVSEASASLPSENGALRRLASLDLEVRNPRIFETAAYAQLINGAPDKSAKTLALGRHLPRSTDDPVWVDDVYTRMTLIENLILDDQDAKALSQLTEWADQSASNLRLDAQGR